MSSAYLTDDEPEWETTNLQFCRCYTLVCFGNNVDIIVYIMATIRSGFLLTPIRMTFNDFEFPIHLKVRLAGKHALRRHMLVFQSS